MVSYSVEPDYLKHRLSHRKDLFRSHFECYQEAVILTGFRGPNFWAIEPISTTGKRARRSCQAVLPIYEWLHLEDPTAWAPQPLARNSHEESFSLKRLCDLTTVRRLCLKESPKHRASWRSCLYLFCICLAAELTFFSWVECLTFLLLEVLITSLLTKSSKLRVTDYFLLCRAYCWESEGNQEARPGKWPQTLTTLVALTEDPRSIPRTQTSAAPVPEYLKVSSLSLQAWGTHVYACTHAGKTLISLKQSEK